MTLLIVSFLAGVLTIVSPCILPILPFVFSRANQPFARGILPMLIGMAATFAAAATLAAVGGSWAVHANEIGRFAAIALLAVFGATLVSSRVAEILSRPLVAFGSRLSNRADEGNPSVGGSLLLGVATGFLWAPCAGPILGIVLTGAALQGVNPQTTLLLAYAAGAATSIALALLAGGRMLAAMRRSLGLGERIRQGVGIAVLAGVAAIALSLDTGLLARLSYAGTAGIEQSLLDRLPKDSAKASTESADSSTTPPEDDARRTHRSSLPVEGRLPSLDGAVEWLNSKPLSAEQLRGKVVLVDFWTYSCINCIRTLPYVRAWVEKYKDQGLVVIGVHAPEFAFEKKIENVERATRDFGIAYPVAIDNDYRIWRAFGNSYWPAAYFIDAEGRIRHHHFGEGEYKRSQQVIQELLAEAKVSQGVDNKLPATEGARAAIDFALASSGETYIGYVRTSSLASLECIDADRAQNYTPGQQALNRSSPAGNRMVEARHG